MNESKLKFRRENGLWIIEDRGVNKVFDTMHEAWDYIFLMREIRPKVPQVAKSLYPVRSLDPRPERKVKRLVWQRVYPGL